MPRPVHLAGQRLRRRPDKCDAGCRRHKLHITHFRRCRRRKLAHSAAPPSSRRNRFAVGGTSCISLISVAAADENSLTPLHRLLPAETASLGFGGSPVGGGNKNSCFAFFRHFCVGGGITTLWPLCLCRNNPARGLFQQKKRLSQSGCSAPTDTLFPPAHSAFSAFLHGGGIITLGVRFMPLKHWTRRSYGGLFAVFMPPRCSPCAG